jgi:dTMP kinase
VVSDRCFWSTVAYQGEGLGLGVDTTRVFCLTATAQREPDLVVLLDVTPQAAAARRDGRTDRIESRGDEYLARVREAFLALAERAGDRVSVLDGTCSVEKTHAAVIKRVEALLGRSL